MRVYPVPIKKNRFKFNFSLTSWLIISNVLFFIIITPLLSRNILLLDAIAINPFNILHGYGFWTPISSMFMHGGIFHLLVNMLSLFFIGSLIEKLLGRKRYFWFYLIAGIFAGLFFVLSAFVFPNEMSSFAVGASGALFGLIGLLIVLTPNLRVYMLFIPIPIKMKYAAPGLLVILWLISVAGNVALGNFAHLGGLLIGLAYGFFLRKRYPKKTKYISSHFS